MNVLQSFITPSDNNYSDESLYLQTIKGDVSYTPDGGICISPRTIISFSSYYNYFSCRTWLNYCSLGIIKLGIDCVGSAKIEVFCKSSGIKEYLFKRVFVSSSLGFNSFDLGVLEDGFSKSMYVKISTESGIDIKSMFFYIDEPPLNEVKLGIVITHFNRKAYVLPAIKRISQELISNSYFNGKIEIIVVDNSKNITTDEACGCTVIPNENLGGSGGFTRGLIYLKDNGFTHCLFMDDDATCEIESIKRTFQILQYSKVDNLAVSGGMLYEHNPTVLHEKGAKYKRMRFTPLRNGTDVSKFDNILITDAYPEHITYGAWWFFAFKINEVSLYPFPFFVKADDMLFGLMNNFKIISPNGICVWGEDFGYKDGPMQRYLGTRGTFAASVIASDSSRMMICRNFMKSIVAMLLSYRYSSANAVYSGMLDFMKGPDYWVNNMTFDKILPSISNVIKDEVSRKIDLHDFDIEHKSIHESKFRKFIRVITLNGMLLPTSMIKDEFVINNKSGVGVFRVIFRSRNVLYYHSSTETGYVVSYDRKKFFSILLSSIFLSIKLCFAFGKIKREYQLKSKDIMSESFWRKTYAKDSEN